MVRTQVTVFLAETDSAQVLADHERPFAEVMEARWAVTAEIDTIVGQVGLS